MKRLILLPLGLVLLSCQADEDAPPPAESTLEFEIETLGRGLDCGLPLVEFKGNLDEVQKITGAASAAGSFYYASGLSQDLWDGEVLLVRIRKSEPRACTTMGPTLPLVTVVSARVDECLYYHRAPTKEVAGPTTGRVNEAVPLVVSFSCGNGCGQFGSFQESSAGNTRTVTVQARYQGCICTQDIPRRQATYNFKAAQPGVYEVKFWKTDSEFVTHTVTVH